MKWKLDRACRTGLLTALVTLLFLSLVAAIYMHTLRDVKEHQARLLAENLASRITQRTYETVSPVYMMAAAIRLHRGNVPDFDQVASDLLQGIPLARAIELAPAGVVRQVHPLRGNEAVLGHDLLKDRGRNREAHIAVVRRQMMVAGPFELIQGDWAPLPVIRFFLPGEQGKATFWGFAIVLVHVQDLLTNAGIMDLERKGYRYQICRVLPEPDTGDCKVFAQPTEGAMIEPLTVTVDLPNNIWRLSLTPESGWITISQWLAVIAVVVLGALAAGYARWLACRQAMEAEDEVAESATME